jgi:hypothetical protein
MWSAAALLPLFQRKAQLMTSKIVENRKIFDNRRARGVVVILERRPQQPRRSKLQRN